MKKSLRPLRDCHFYAILDTSYFNQRDPVFLANQMIAGGVDIIQLRAKNQTLQECSKLANAVLSVTRPHGIPLIVNDHPEIALEIGADGIHIGQDDQSISKVRKIVGDKMWVGKSTHSLKQALEAQAEAVDYIGVGPIFATPTKPTYTPVGLKLVREVAPQISIPFFCIGGIKLGNADQVLKAGAKRLVVVSGILQAEDIVQYCQEFKKVFYRFN